MGIWIMPMLICFVVILIFIQLNLTRIHDTLEKIAKNLEKRMGE